LVFGTNWAIFKKMVKKIKIFTIKGLIPGKKSVVLFQISLKNFCPFARLDN